jgi:hypothetical protein
MDSRTCGLVKRPDATVDAKKTTSAGPNIEVPEVRTFDLTLECGQCHTKLQPGQELLKFVICGCANRASICLQNRKHAAHLIGAKDDQNTFVHVHISPGVELPRMTLRKWNLLQLRFKTDGALEHSSK